MASVDMDSRPCLIGFMVETKVLSLGYGWPRVRAKMRLGIIGLELGV